MADKSFHLLVSHLMKENLIYCYMSDQPVYYSDSLEHNPKSG